MIYVLAIFSSRNETLYFANMLKMSGCNVGIVNTPKEAGQACGISVKFHDNNLSKAKQCLSSKPFRSFVGFFRVRYDGLWPRLERI